MRAQAVNNYCTLEMVIPQEVKKGLLYIPQNVAVTPRWGIIESVGQGVPDLGGVLQKPDVNVGDTVYANSHGLLDLYEDHLGRGRLKAVSTLDILAVLENKETMKIQPLGSLIEIEKIERTPEEGQVLLTDAKALPSNIARVKTLGKGWRAADGTPIPFHVKEGQLIGFEPLRTQIVDFTTLGIDAKTTLIMHGDIVCTFEDDE